MNVDEVMIFLVASLCLVSLVYDRFAQNPAAAGCCLCNPLSGYFAFCIWGWNTGFARQCVQSYGFTGGIIINDYADR